MTPSTQPSARRVRRGVSLLVCCGKWGGFQFWFRGAPGLPYVRVCLGWVSISVNLFDYEDFIHKLIES